MWVPAVFGPCCCHGQPDCTCAPAGRRTSNRARSAPARCFVLVQALVLGGDPACPLVQPVLLQMRAPMTSMCWWRGGG